MEGNIKVELNELALEVVGQMAKREIAELVADEFMKSDQAREIIEGIKIDIDEIKRRVMDSMVNEIINNWKENGNESKYY